MGDNRNNSVDCLGVMMALWLCKKMAVFFRDDTEVWKGEMTSCLGYTLKYFSKE